MTPHTKSSTTQQLIRRPHNALQHAQSSLVFDAPVIKDVAPQQRGQPAGVGRSNADTDVVPHGAAIIWKVNRGRFFEISRPSAYTADFCEIAQSLTRNLKVERIIRI